YQLANNYTALGLSFPIKTYVVGFAPSTQAISYSMTCTSVGQLCPGGQTCTSVGMVCPAYTPTVQCDINQTSGGNSLNPVVFEPTTHTCNAAVLAQNPQLQVCCDLALIAYNGGTNTPYYASSPNALRVAISNILSQVTATETSRTPPVYAAGYDQNDTWAGQYQFDSSFNVAPGNIWNGVLERRRIVCKSNAPT